jgi:putative ABC transport system permease protein
MWRATLKSLLARKARLLMSTFAIVLGVAFVVGSLVFSDTLNRSFTGLFASSVADVTIRPSGNQVGQGGFGTLSVDASLVDKARQAQGAARVDGLLQADGVYIIGDDNKIVGGQGAPAFGFSWTDAPAAGGLEGLVILDGQEPNAPREVVLDERTAELGGYELGDTVKFTSSLDIKLPSATLVGLAGYRDGGSLNGATTASFDLAWLQSLLPQMDNRYTTIWVAAKEGVTQEELKSQVNALIADDAVEVQTGDEIIDETSDALAEALSFITTFLLVFALISLVVGIYLIVNTFSILVAQRTRELALLRALGASRGQVRRSVLGEAFVVGLVGSGLGVALGLGLAALLKVLFGQLGLDLSGQSLVVEPRAYIAAFAVGVPVTMAAAYFPARRTAKVSPVQALGDHVALSQSSLGRRLILGIGLILAGCGLTWVALFGDIENRPLVYLGVGLLSVLLGVTAMSPMLARPFLQVMQRSYQRVYGAVGNLAGQNGLRNPRRTAATAAALMITMALVTVMATMGSSAKASIDKLTSTTYLGDYVVSSPTNQGFSPQIAADIEKLQRVDKVVSYSREFFQDDKYDFVSVGTSYNNNMVEDFSIEVAEGTGDLNRGETLLWSGFAEEEGLAVGDSLTLDFPSGKETLKVAGLADTDNVFIDSPILLRSDDYEQFGMPRKDLALIVEVADPSPQAYAELKAALADEPLVTAKDQADYAEEFRAPIDRLLSIIYALLGLALIIGVLGIVNTLALSALERTRELGLLRAIGLDRRQTRRMVRLESIVISVLGVLLGIGIGVPFAYTILYALRDEGLEVIAIPWGQLMLFLVTAVVIGVVAAVLPARRAARMDVLSAISTE